jgi:hypothetical protein
LGQRFKVFLLSLGAPIQYGEAVDNFRSVLVVNLVADGARQVHGAQFLKSFRKVIM